MRSGAVITDAYEVSNGAEYNVGFRLYVCIACPMSLRCPYDSHKGYVSSKLDSPNLVHVVILRYSGVIVYFGSKGQRSRSQDQKVSDCKINTDYGYYTVAAESRLKWMWIESIEQGLMSKSTHCRSFRRQIFAVIRSRALKPNFHYSDTTRHDTTCR